MAASLGDWRQRYSFALGASRAGRAGERSQEDLKRALAEVDGLFAGLKCLDKLEPSSDAPSPNSITTPPVSVVGAPPEPPGPESGHPFLRNSNLSGLEFELPSLAFDAPEAGQDD